MWSYYGSKNRIVKCYPKPVEHKINEVFAGAAYYSLEYFENDVTLVDKNPLIISIWEYLQQASYKEIAGLPVLPAGFRIERDQFDCDGQYNLMKFLIVQAAYGGNNIVSKWGAIGMAANIKRVCSHLHKIKHWKFITGSYDDLPNTRLTWFIDPPYFVGGHKYPFNNKKIDYQHLAGWCKDREGQVIVCENTNASWLPFIPFKKIQGVAKTSTEAIWTNYHTHFDNVQQTLF
jgi:hypothetical protein